MNIVKSAKKIEESTIKYLDLNKEMLLYLILFFSASGIGDQKALSQILDIENKVKNPTSKETATIKYCSDSKPAFAKINLPQKPESGGIPANEKAEITNKTLIKGKFLYTPPNLLKLKCPFVSFTMPLIRKRLVLASILWIKK